MSVRQESRNLCKPAADTYAIKTINVEMTDGQLTCEFPSGHICRMDAIIVRLIEADKTALKAAIDNAADLPSITLAGSKKPYPFSSV